MRGLVQGMIGWNLQWRIVKYFQSIILGEYEYLSSHFCALAM
jgi:hypothetical protein